VISTAPLTSDDAPTVVTTVLCVLSMPAPTFVAVLLTLIIILRIVCIPSIQYLLRCYILLDIIHFIRHYGKVELELGYENGRPHYQLWVSMKPKVPTGALIKALYLTKKSQAPCLY
jgi:hypothetical protein